MRTTSGFSSATRALQLDVAAVAGHQRVRDGEPEPRSLAHRLGREEGLEDALAELRRDPRTAVGDLDEHAAVLCIRSQADFALSFDRLYRVRQEIHEDLVDLSRIAAGTRDVAVLVASLDPV